MADWIYRQRDYRLMCKTIKARPHPCWLCGKRADTVDHVPPVASFPTPQQWRGVLYPACKACNSSTGASYGNRQRAATTERPQSRKW